MDNFIKEIGRSYIVSSFLPAALFVPLGFLIFLGFTPRLLINGIETIAGYLSRGWVVVFPIIAVIWVGFWLYSSVDWVIKLFEGYMFPEEFQTYRSGLMYEKYADQLGETKAWLAFFANRTQPAKKFRARRLNVIGRAVNEFQSLEIEVPLILDEDNEFDAKVLLPTRLGNVLRASEIYPQQRYQMEGMTIWPRLYKVFPETYLRELEEKLNQMVFMLNSALLSFGIAAMALVAGLVGLPVDLYSKITQQSMDFSAAPFYLRGYQHISPLEYMGIGLAFLTMGYMIYHISINVVEDYAIIIRSGYDLYRFDLLRKLNLPIPPSLNHEKTLWRNLSEFFVAGEMFGVDPDYFVYQMPKRRIEEWNASMRRAKEAPAQAPRPPRKFNRRAARQMPPDWYPEI